MAYKPCRVCASPFRYQIEEAWKNKPKHNPLVRQSIADKYMKELGIKDIRTFSNLMVKHFEVSHFVASKSFPYIGHAPGSPQPMPKVTLHSLSQGLLEIGQQMVEFYKKNPMKAIENLDFNQVIKAQDAITKRMEVEVHQDELKLAMARMFAGLNPVKVEEGELVGGETQQLPAVTPTSPTMETDDDLPPFMAKKEKPKPKGINDLSDTENFEPPPVLE